MAVKCIAMGSRLMGDDAIGIKVLEALFPRLKQENIRVILAETDPGYALSQIEDGDFLFILDATLLGTAPGSVSFIPLPQAIKIKPKPAFAHEQSLLHLLHLYNMQVLGYVIGIEVGNIDFCDQLSAELKEAFLSIQATVMDFIEATQRRISHA